MCAIVCGSGFPFLFSGFDADNDAVFINQTVLDYCRQDDLGFTRSRAYRKNDQAWIEQKNGAVVRKLVGYNRLEGMAATTALATLYEASRLYVNFFQPSFKLKGKRREGSRVTKHYHAPATPYQRLIDSAHIPELIKTQLSERFEGLDPIRLLGKIRDAQGRLAVVNGEPGNTREEQTSLVAQKGALEREERAFVASLQTAWRDGEVRPTHRNPVRAARH